MHMVGLRLFWEHCQAPPFSSEQRLYFLQVGPSVPGLQRAIGKASDTLQFVVVDPRLILPVYLVEGHWASQATPAIREGAATALTSSSVSYLCTDLADWINAAENPDAMALDHPLPKDIQLQLVQALALPPQARI
jgi:hypothetical protein